MPTLGPAWNYYKNNEETKKVPYLFVTALDLCGGGDTYRTDQKASIKLFKDTVKNYSDYNSKYIWHTEFIPI